MCDEYTRNGPVKNVVELIPKTGISGEKLSFQQKWYSNKKWLEYSKFHDAAFCFPCRVFESTQHDTNVATWDIHGPNTYENRS